MNKYILDTTVTGNDIAFDSRLGIAGVMTLFQLACGKHTHTVGVDYASVDKNHNAKWVITDVRFEFERLPVYSEDITVTTWPLAPGPVRFPRIFEMADKNKEVLAYAYTNWCLLDKDTDAILRTSLLGEPFGEYITDKPLGAAPKERGGYETKLHHIHTARISDLDMNGHVNNISYIKMALDCFSADEYKNLYIKACNVYYKTQAYEGENIMLERADLPDKIYIKATVEDRTVFMLTLEV